MTDQKRADAQSAPQANAADQPGYPGRDLGLPEAGRGSVAGMARRVGALFIDWLLCWVIVVAAIRPYQADVAYWTLVLFAGQDYLFSSLTGLTVGKQLVRIRVVRLDGGMIGPLWGLVRTLLLLTVVPPLMVDRDLRGLHDRAANTVVVRV
ncbi:MAG: RDD family protein [Streptosporangiaceae bacterium]